MAIQDTIDAADAVVVLLNAATLPESITFERTFIPEFDPRDMGADPVGVVVPASIDINIASRVTDSEDNIIEIGLGRVVANFNAAVVSHLETVEAIKREIRGQDNQSLTMPGDGGTVQFTGVEVVLFVPELVQQSIALSVVRVTYRGFA